MSTLKTNQVATVKEVITEVTISGAELNVVAEALQHCADAIWVSGGEFQINQIAASEDEKLSIEDNKQFGDLMKLLAEQFKQLGNSESDSKSIIVED